MLRLELDWAADGEPDRTPYDDEPMRVEYDAAPGPAGWPTVRVYVWANEGEEAYVASMRLDGWLRDVYGCDEDMAQELASLADVV